MPKKAKHGALKSALSMKFEEKNLLVVESIEIKEPKTKVGRAFLDKLKVDSALIVDSHANAPLFLSLRNIPEVKAVDHSQLNVYDILNYKWLVLSQQAFDSVTEKLK